MKSIGLFSIFLILLNQAFAQTAKEVLDRVIKRQRKLNAVSYTLYRHDSLVTGHVRTITGSASMVRNKTDSLFGYSWIAFDDSTETQLIYDGRKVIELDHSTMEYLLEEPPASKYKLIGKPAGRILFVDIFQIDTSQVVKMNVDHDNNYYYLHLTLQDIPSENVIKRYRRYTIDKKTLLPKDMTFHQETMGKVQDLYFSLNNIQEDKEAAKMHSQNTRVPADYAPKKLAAPRPGSIKLGQKAPHFDLPLLIGDSSVSSSRITSKLVLLDFWELWCEPCIKAFPKIDDIQDSYRNRGLTVIAITCDTTQLEITKAYIQRKNYGFLIARGDERIKSEFDIQAFPTYVLIDKSGTIVYYGNTDDVDAEIKKRL